MPLVRQVHLLRRPEGVPKPDDFGLVEVELREPVEGEVVVEGLLMSVDPYMRTRFDTHPLGAPLLGGGVGRVVASHHPGFQTGDLVRHLSGFQAQFVTHGDQVAKLHHDPELPLSVYMHALGATGRTAYGGLLETGALKLGEEVFISTAAGAVGSVAAQIAKLKGCYVAGSTGSDAKAGWLREELNLDAVLNYRAEPLAETLPHAMPRGIDVYFENVGGAHLDAVLPLMNDWGRIPVCGMISTYNGAGEGVRNLFSMIYKRLRMQGFVTPDFAHLEADFQRDMTTWLKAGQIKYRETIVDGLENAPGALIGLFQGNNTGKMLVRLCD